MIIPFILSGGAGSRLWPLSRGSHPKQLLPLVGDRTMVQETAARFDGAGFADPVFICNAAHLDAIRHQVLDARYVIEPAGRNTAACAAVAALMTGAQDLCLLCPADHHITDVAAFRTAISRAEAAARAGRLVTFGIAPTGPETGYGYIERGAAAEGETFVVKAFREKPDRSTADAYLAKGTFSWNAGIFLFSPTAMIRELDAHAPDVLRGVRAAVDAARHEGEVTTLDAEAFARVPSISVDYAVMEPTDRAAVLPVSIGWSDIGSFLALRDVRTRDGDGNALADGTLQTGSRDCLVETDGPRVSLVGVENLAVVVKNGEVMVCALDAAQDVKTIAGTAD